MPNAIPIVFVVDDDDSVRRSLRLLIESEGWRAETFGSARDFLLRPRGVTAPSCLVLDVVLPDLNGCEVQATLEDRADMPIIFISGYGDVPTTVRAMKAGAVEFFTKPFAGDVVLGAIRTAINRSCAALASVAEMRTLRDSFASLSPREREVMALVVSGRLNKQTAIDLGISEITVKAHRGQLMRKMKAGSICELVRMASRLCVGPALGAGRPAAIFAQPGMLSDGSGRGPATRDLDATREIHEERGREVLPMSARDCNHAWLSVGHPALDQVRP